MNHLHCLVLADGARIKPFPTLPTTFSCAPSSPTTVSAPEPDHSSVQDSLPAPVVAAQDSDILVGDIFIYEDAGLPYAGRCTKVLKTLVSFQAIGVTKSPSGLRFKPEWISKDLTVRKFAIGNPDASIFVPLIYKIPKRQIFAFESPPINPGDPSRWSDAMEEAWRKFQPK